MSIVSLSTAPIPGQNEAAMADVTHMTCMEVWGGNQSADSFVTMAGLDAWVYARPYQNSEAGGDVYYVSSCATGRITRMLLADVSGHGTKVATMASSLRTLMRKYVNFIDQSRFVRSMNESFTRESQDGIFATAVVATFFSPTCHLTLCNAGHPPPLVYRAREQEWSILRHDADEGDDPTDVPLGILDLTNYRQFDLKFEVGDLILCYTDSLVESKDEAGELIGSQRLLNLARSIDATDPTQVVPALLERIRNLHPGNLEDDDVTAMLFRLNGSGMDYSFTLRLLAPFRVVGSLFRDHVFARPDFKLANIGGALIPSLNRFWGRPRR
jgi:hypothetical protein